MPAAPLVFEAVEPRILLSGDAVAAVGPPAAVGAPAAPPALVQAMPQADRATQGPARELAVVDPTVRDSAALLAELADQAALGRTLTIVVLQPGQDGLSAVGEALARASDAGERFDTVHLVGDGSEARARLGSAWLDGPTLRTRAAEIAAWSGALADDADLLLYGCDVGRSEAGRQLVQDLATLTGADVAASSDRTGAAARHANWVLEVSSGAIESEIAVSAAFQERWAGSLDVFVVSNTDATGPGSLAQAIDDANLDPDLDQIVFALPAGATILLDAPLVISSPVLLDGYSNNPGGGPGIELDFSASPDDGLVLTTGADGSEVRGLAVYGAPVHGIVVDTSGAWLHGNHVGTDAAGLQARSNGADGILVVGNGNVIGDAAGDGNLVSGNTGSGIRLDDGATGNLVVGNRIGLDASGAAPLGNGNGIQVGTAGLNRIGGATAAEGNLIAGNTGEGVLVESPTVVAGNVFAANAGPAISTSALLPDPYAGNRDAMNTLLVVSNAAAGPGSLAQAVDDANQHPGLDRIAFELGTDRRIAPENTLALTDPVFIDGYATNAAGVPGVELDFTGMGGDGLSLDAGASGSEIRGLNIHSAGGNGVTLEASGVLLYGNYIGIDFTGTIALYNGGDGVQVRGANNRIGSPAEAANVISGNWWNGVGIIGAGATGNLVQNNLLGVAADGHSLVTVYEQGGAIEQTGNWVGVTVGSGASGNTIGGATPGEGNVISGNYISGVDLSEDSVGNSVIGNRIGTDVSGTQGVPNGQPQEDGSVAGGIGVFISNGAFDNRIGGLLPGEGNLIAANETGVWIGAGDDEPAERHPARNVVVGNRIGLDAQGQPVLGGSTGVYINNFAGLNTIGGPGGVGGNEIAGQMSEGIATGVATAILGNVIHDTAGRGIVYYQQAESLVMTFARADETSTRVAGALAAPAGTTWRLEFFAGNAAALQGSDDARLYLGSSTFTVGGTAGSGQLIEYFRATLGAVDLQSFAAVSVTATRLDAQGLPVQSTGLSTAVPFDLRPEAAPFMSLNDDIDALSAQSLALGRQAVVDDQDLDLVALTLSVSRGALRLVGTPADVEVTRGPLLDANGSTSRAIHLSGDQQALQHALAAIEYLPPADFLGVDTVTLVGTDARGGVSAASATLHVALPDATVRVRAPERFAAAPGASVAIGGNDATPLLAEAAYADASFELRITAAGGTVTLDPDGLDDATSNDTAGADGSPPAGVSQATTKAATRPLTGSELLLVGNIEQINAALRTAVFSAATGFAGTASIELRLDDPDATDSRGTSVAVVTVQVAAAPPTTPTTPPSPPTVTPPVTPPDGGQPVPAGIVTPEPTSSGTASSASAAAARSTPAPEPAGTSAAASPAAAATPVATPVGANPMRGTARTSDGETSQQATVLAALAAGALETAGTAVSVLATRTTLLPHAIVQATTLALDRHMGSAREVLATQAVLMPTAGMAATSQTVAVVELPASAAAAAQERGYGFALDRVQSGSAAVTALIALWALRAGGLAAMTMAVVPAWGGFDPVLVLSKPGAAGGDWPDRLDSDGIADERAVQRLLDGEAR